MKILLLLITLLFSFSAFSQKSGTETLVQSISSDNAKFGVAASGAGGITDFSIASPNSKAIYSGFGLDLKLSAPIWQNNIVAFNGGVGFRYIDASNNANSSASKEFVRQNGLGLGLNLNVYRILLGVDYHHMHANHYWVGNPNDELSYDMAVLSTYLGIHFSLSESMQVLFSYTNSSGKLPSKRTNFTADAPYEATTFWVHLSYGSGETLSKFFQRLFK